jgi:type IV secretory pathway VirB10-like protein
MSEPSQGPPEHGAPATVPEQPQAAAPLQKKFPLLMGLAAIVLLFGIVNLLSLISGKKSEPPRSSMPLRPATANPQQVSSFETQQNLEAKRDADERARQQQITDQIRQLQAEQQAIAPGPEGDNTAPMTPAQRAAIYGDNNPNAPKRTSGMSEAQAEAKQHALAREKQHQDAINSDTVAIDFAHPSAAVSGERPISNVGSDTTSPELATGAAGDAAALGITNGKAGPSSQETASTSSGKPVQTISEQRQEPESRGAAISRYDFDSYEGRLYRVFEGTVFEGVVTNHIDGGFNGPILIMLTTDYYSHDHQQLLLPQGTRLIGTLQSVNSGQQRKLFVVFHRAVCPDGFSLDLDKFAGLDPMGTTGLATKVSHGYFTAFAAAASIGGLGGLAQIGNSGIGVLGGDTSIAIRNGLSEQTGQEAEQILNHFLNRLPVITLKEGSRARVYVGRDILLPSYADHRVIPNR